MANPTGAANVVGHTLRFGELGFPLANGNLSANTLLTTYQTSAPETVFVFVQLVSGTGTLNVQATPSGTAYSAADSAVPLNATSLTGTAGMFAVCNTSATNPQINVQIATSGCQVGKVLILPLSALTVGEDWFNVRDGVMAVVNQHIGDGSGNFTFGIADPASPQQ